MSKRRRKDRLYRKRARYYADLRDYSDVGGGLEAMKPDGSIYATEDRDVASRLLARRLTQLEAIRAGLAPDEPRNPLLADYAKWHLRAKAGARRASTVTRNEVALRQVLAYFGSDVRLSHIDVAALTEYIAYRRQQPGSRTGSTVSAQTVLHELNALGNLYKRAVSEGEAAANPVRSVMDKPRVEREEAVYLESDEAARLLEVAREMDARPQPRAVRYLYPILGTFLYTGARLGEVFGLEVADVDVEGGRVLIRPNSWRQLKNRHQKRHVPLWPDLRRLLESYLEQWGRTEGLVFPSPNGGMLGGIRGSLKAALRGANIDKRVTLHTLRHTYTAARLQTTDHGAPVAVYTIMKELGHRSFSLIEDVYGHVPQVRHRSAVVEYRRAEVLDLAAHREESAMERTAFSVTETLPVSLPDH